MKSIVFVLDHRLHSYRSDLFDMLSKRYRVTVVHRGPALLGDFRFNQMVLKYVDIGPLFFVRNLRTSDFDCCIFMQNLRMVNVYFNLIGPFRKRTLLWGIGTSSAKGLGSELLVVTFFRNLLVRASKGLGLYSGLPYDKYWRSNKKKIFVVGNSCNSPCSIDTSSCAKEYILFVGSLNKRKGLDHLLLAFSKSHSRNEHLRLLIVGDGPERDNVEYAISKYGLEGCVEMAGQVNSHEKKADIFSKAYFVVSPSQAGLSIVDSFSFGVPFVCSKNAINGGEIGSVINEYNGVLFEDVLDLDDIIDSFFDGRRSSVEMGRNAYDFYEKNLTMDSYTSRFVWFIESSMFN